MDQPTFSCIEGDALDTATAYRLIVGCVAPRPVAWITTLDEEGRIDVAPFSSYNYGATSLPMLAFNIVRSRELVVNVATEHNMELMHCSA